MPELDGRWQTAPFKCRLDPGQLSLWRFRLDQPQNKIDSLCHCLSADEQQRVQRLRVPEKRAQFIVGRARLRNILAQYITADPAELRFNYGEQGKPVLSDSADLYFNLAHSGVWGLVAVTEAGEVGVDLERIDPRIDYLSVAKRFFSAPELGRLRSVSQWRQRRCFYRIWTEKEAILKMTGTGFTAVAETETAAFDWIRSVPVAKGYLAALACSKPVDHIQRFHFC